MPFCMLWRRVALIRYDVSEEHIAFIRVKRISDLLAPSSRIVLTMMIRGETVFRNVGSYQSHTASQSRRQHLT
jgi:hypothetical protein